MANPPSDKILTRLKGLRARMREGEQPLFSIPAIWENAADARSNACDLVLTNQRLFGYIYTTFPRERLYLDALELDAITAVSIRQKHFGAMFRELFVSDSSKRVYIRTTSKRVEATYTALRSAIAERQAIRAASTPPRNEQTQKAESEQPSVAETAEQLAPRTASEETDQPSVAETAEQPAPQTASEESEQPSAAETAEQPAPQTASEESDQPSVAETAEQLAPQTASEKSEQPSVAETVEQPAPQTASEEQPGEPRPPSDGPIYRRQQVRRPLERSPLGITILLVGGLVLEIVGLLAWVNLGNSQMGATFILTGLFAVVVAILVRRQLH